MASANYYNDNNNAQYQPPPGPPQDYQMNNQPTHGYPPPQGYPPPHQAQYQPQDAYKSGTEQAYNQTPPNYANADNKEDFQQAFQIQKPKFNDLWAALLFIATLLGFAAVSGVTLYRYSRYHSFNGGGIYGGGNDFSLNTNTIILFVFVLCVAFVLSWGYFLAARAFTKQFVWISGILNIVLALGTAIYYLYLKLWGAGIVFLIFAIFAVICFISWIPRIPFAVVMLQQTQDVARLKRVHVFLVSFFGGVVAIAFAAWFSVTLVAIYAAYMPGNAGSNANPACAQGGCSSGRVIGLIVFVTFAMYWVSEFIKNAIHTIIAGVYGSWYFFGGKPGGIPKGATMGAFRRAMTYSFGSISFGSLLIALVQMLRQACSVAQSQAAQDGNIIGYIFACILGCFISLLQWLVEFFNRYAFCHIALYGKAYIPAAKDTWTMMKDRGIDALVNDCLVGPVLTMGSLFVAYTCALLSDLYLHYTTNNTGYNSGRTYTPVVMAFSFLIGLQTAQIFLQPIASGVDTIFVAMGWDPDVVARDHPEFWQKLVQTYPRVQEVIHPGV